MNSLFEESFGVNTSESPNTAVVSVAFILDGFVFVRVSVVVVVFFFAVVFVFVFFLALVPELISSEVTFRAQECFLRSCSEAYKCPQL